MCVPGSACRILSSVQLVFCTNLSSLRFPHRRLFFVAFKRWGRSFLSVRRLSARCFLAGVKNRASPAGGCFVCFGGAVMWPLLAVRYVCSAFLRWKCVCSCEAFNPPLNRSSGGGVWLIHIGSCPLTGKRQSVSKTK